MINMNSNAANEFKVNTVTSAMSLVARVRLNAGIAGIFAPFAGKVFGNVLNMLTEYFRKYTSFYRDCILE